MTLFNQQEFPQFIVNRASAQHLFDHKHNALLNTLVEIQTRHLLENAIKLINKDARDSLSLQDILDAAKMLNHSQLKIDPVHSKSPSQNNKSTKEPLMTCDELIENELKLLQNVSITKPKLEGKWIIIKNKIPATSNNLHIKSKLQILKNKQFENQPKIKLFNIIKDDPISLLTLQQYHTFNKISKFIELNDSKEKSIELVGDLNDIMPFVVKLMGEREINEAAIIVLLNLIDNKYVWLGIQYNLKKTLNILLNYEGKASLEVGFKVAQLVERFYDKYPKLRDIYVGSPNTYSNILKKIPFEIILGIPMQMEDEEIRKIVQEQQTENQMAKLCMKAFLTYSSTLFSFRQYLKKKKDSIYWQPSKQFKSDAYLTMY